MSSVGKDVETFEISKSVVTCGLEAGFDGRLGTAGRCGVSVAEDSVDTGKGDDNGGN